MDKYIKAAIRAKAIKIPKKIRLYKYSNQMNMILKKINKNKEKYVVICTGSQGEEGSVLRRIADRKFGLNLDDKDHVIFSCSVIPTEINIQSRKNLEETLEKQRVRIFRDIHCSGHAFREDMRDLIRIIKPRILIPAHADKPKVDEFVKLAQEEGYELNKNIIVVKSGDSINLI